MLEFDGEGVAWRISQAIHEENITQVALAEAAQVTEQAVSQWCKLGQIATEHLPAVAQKLDRTIDYLLTGHGIKRLSEALAKIDITPDDLIGLTDEQQADVQRKKSEAARLVIDLQEQNRKAYEAQVVKRKLSEPFVSHRRTPSAVRPSPGGEALTTTKSPRDAVK